MLGNDYLPAFIGSLGWPELLVIGLLGLLFFGRRLPEVGRSLGRGIVEFKKGLKETEEEITRPPRGDEESGPTTLKVEDDTKSEVDTKKKYNLT